MNVEDYCLWDFIQMDFAEFEARHFDELNNTTWRVVRDYCYLYEFWIDHNFGPGRNRTTTMLKAVEVDWNNKWTLEQIEWVEERYHSKHRISDSTSTTCYYTTIVSSYVKAIPIYVSINRQTSVYI